MRFWKSNEVFGDDHDWIQQTPFEQVDQHGIIKAPVSQWCAAGNYEWIKINWLIAKKFFNWWWKERRYYKLFVENI